MTSVQKNKLVDIIWATVYLILTVALVVSAIITFNKLYYSQIYVSGSSMNPTFYGSAEKADYGYVDKHDSIKKQLKRYQIVVTYYPGDTENSDYKIKRLWVLPGETFKFVSGKFYLLKTIDGQSYWENMEIPFKRNPENGALKTYKDGSACTLKDDEYFVAGDNWAPGMSEDSFSSGVGPIKYSLLVGVVTKMCGYCKVNKTYNKETKKYDVSLSDKRPYEDGKEHYFLGVDY